MKRWALFIPFITFTLLGFLLWRGLYLDPKDIPSALVDKPFPEFSLPTLIGEELKKLRPNGFFTGYFTNCLGWKLFQWI